MYSTETNGLMDANAYHKAVTFQIDHNTVIDWTTPGLKIIRLRLLSDPGFPVWDVSYCHGMLAGKPVQVQLPFSQIPKNDVKGFILKHAIRDKVFAKGLGIFDAISKLW